MTEQVNLREVIATLWRPVELALPAFADDRNVKLHSDLREISGQISAYIEELTQLEARTVAMDRHKDAVQQELKHAQTLAEAKRKEVDSETHMMTLVERDLGRMQAKIRECGMQRQQIEERQQSCQTSLLKNYARLSEVKKEYQWLEDERAEWHLASEQKNDDAFALQKYTAIDEKRKSDLEQSLKRQQTVVTELTDLLRAEINKTLTAQVSLDKAAVSFSRLQEDRRVAMAQFKQAVALLESKDKQETLLNERLEHARLDLEDLKSTDRRVQGELEEVHRQRHASDIEFEGVEREANRAMSALVQAEKEVEQMKGELLIQRAALASTRRDLGSKKEHLEQMQASYQNRIQDGQRLDARLELLMTVKEEMDRKALSLEDMIDYLAKVVASVTQEHAMKDAEYKAAQARLQTMGQRLIELKQQEAAVDNDISGLRSGLKGLSQRIITFENQIQQQRRHIYNADYQIQSLTRKLSIARGDHSLEELAVLKQNIASLTQQLESELRTAKLVKQQTGSVTSEIERLNRNLAELKAKRERVDTDLHEQMLASNTAGLYLTKLENDRAEALLKLDSMKIQRERLLREYENRSAIVFGLTNRKEQLRIGAVKRTKELDAVKALLQQEVRLVDQDLSAVRLELKKRRIFIEKLRIRCDILTDRVGAITCAASGKNPEEADPRTAQSDAIINFGKKKADLQARFEEYSSQLKKAELEVAGLQQALESLRRSNAEIRRDVRPVTSGSAEAERLKRAKQDLEQADSEILYLRTNIRNAKREMEAAESQNSDLQERVDELAAALHDVEYGVE
ncbi:Coiled-coil protein [Giardia muris]|uniref:Coiled-coil protein n=1 Tax=Giardia muris TaxID=5742 RepID=A0A4Z1SZ85_GIAMU|nr:Coiled-coil protein [Giardia muris]|eukprot:TNJ28798.1 Coiled-coil protein [Giardia muris]